MLVRMQKEHWDPLLAWAKEELGVDFVLAEGFAPAKQSTVTKSKMETVLQGMDAWELAGQSPLVMHGKNPVLIFTSIRTSGVRLQILRHRLGIVQGTSNL